MCRARSSTTRVALPGTADARGGLTPSQQAAMDEAIAVLRHEGAVVVDPADIPSVVDARPRSKLSGVGCLCVASTTGRDAIRGCSVAFKYGMKRDFNAWLASLGRCGAGEIAVRRCAGGISTTARPARSSTRRRISTSPTRWTSSAIVPGMRPIAGRTCC